MSSGAYVGQNFVDVKNLMNNGQFQKAYDLLQKISDKCSEWYYLTGLSAMKIGYYDEGDEYIQKAQAMDPANETYDKLVNKYMEYRNNYNSRSYNYNRHRRNDLGGCCCCCCDDDCCCCCGDDMCDTLCCLACLDECCECSGGDFISCC